MPGFVLGDEDITAQDKKTDEQVKSDAALPSATHNVVDLPSKGKLGYPAYAEYRDIMVRDEEVLSSSTIDTYAKTLNAVLKNIMNDCPFYEQMSIHDRDYMLIWVWANNYSSLKKVEVTCQHCEHKEEKTIDLTKLPQKDIAEDFKSSITIPIKKTKGNITARQLTVSDELFAEEYSKKDKNMKYENAILFSSIDLGMPVPFETKVRWIRENMSSKELHIVRKFHEKYSFGISSTIEHTCPACGEVTHGAVPFQAADVLFPTLSDDIEEYL